jgi:type I restriction enzyme, S subunit
VTWVPLKRVADVWPSNVDKLTVDGEHPVRLVNYTDVYYGDRLNPGLDLMSATATTDEIAKFRLQRGDVILTKDSETADDIGISAYVDEVSPDMVCGYHLSLVRPRGAVGRYLHYAISSTHARRQMSVAATGVTRFGLRAESVGSLSVWIPPEAKQRTIADHLDAETARIDAVIAKKQQLIHLLEERLDTLTDAHFAPRGLEPTVRLARLASVQTGVTLNAAKANVRETVKMPYLRVANVQPGWLDLSEVKEVDVEPAVATRSVLRVGDVLMTEGGDIDKLGRGTVWRGQIENCLHQNHVFAVRPRSGRLESDFLAGVTRTSYARAYFESTGVQSTNLASTNSFKVADFRVPALDIRTQRARCSSYEQSAQPLFDSAARLRRQIELLTEHRQALITATVTGEHVFPGAA